MTDILAVIGRLSFRFAKTMPWIPHEYTLSKEQSTRELELAYSTLLTTIQRDGVQEWFGKNNLRRYLYPGDGWRYWVYGPNPKNGESCINRNTLANAQKLRARGIVRDFTP